MSDQFPSHAQVLAQHLRYQDRPDRGEWRVFCSCESRKWFTEPIEVISDETYIAHVEQMWREACTVTTVEQLDALPEGTVIHTVELPEDTCGSGAWTKCRDTGGDWYWWAMDFGEPASEVPLPARVIHHPDWETK